MSAAWAAPALRDVHTINPCFDEGPREEEQEPATLNAAAAKASGNRLAFYRRHTEKILRRYLYASMQVGRAPSALSEPICRGWVSSRQVRTFEDAVIFVLDMEACLKRLGPLDRELLFRVVIQEYTQAEAATLLGMSVRGVCTRFPQALDRLTARLLDAGVLVTRS